MTGSRGVLVQNLRHVMVKACCQRYVLQVHKLSHMLTISGDDVRPKWVSLSAAVGNA